MNMSSRCLSRSSILLLRRAVSTNSKLPSAVYFDASRESEAAVSTTPYSLLNIHQREFLDSALRVDQAGEVAANWIYKGQLTILNKDPRTGPLIQAMWDQERKHLTVMNTLQVQHRIRPTLLSDIAKVAGFGLGAVSALLGREAAMTCTEAVETVIGEHYDDQLKAMELLPADHPSISLLKDVIREFRDDELEHLDTAVNEFSQRAPAHALLSSVIGAGCMVAIEVCKKI